MPTLEVLLPTYNRPESLVMVLSGLASQTYQGFGLIVADQSTPSALKNNTAQALSRVLEAKGNRVTWHNRPPLYGIAEQRDFLLHKSCADLVLFLDDDVWMEPWVIEALKNHLTKEGCGFVGAFPAGLSFLHDIRPHQQRIEFWEGPTQPEVVRPGSAAWERYHLHRAANIFHAAKRLNLTETRLYKVAWVASCVLYDRKKLLEVGGFGFWKRLPRYHSGEEVLVQNLLMRRFGGCAMIPSGTYSSELPSSVLNPQGTVDGHALELLDEMASRFAPETLHSP